MAEVHTYATTIIKKKLLVHGVTTSYANGQLVFSKDGKSVSFFLADENYNSDRETFIAIDYLVTAPEKIVAMVLSKLKLNKSIFARNCDVRKTDKKTAEQFAERYHLMNSANSAFTFGLYLKDELLAIASFSKGRKMDRLLDHQRSYELIRFCCKSGISVTGGLTKLLKHFCLEKKAGDIMTYVDKQWSNGESFIKAGFKKTGETPPNYFLIDRKSYERHYLKLRTKDFDTKKFYLTQNSGNIKLIFSPDASNNENV